MLQEKELGDFCPQRSGRKKVRLQSSGGFTEWSKGEWLRGKEAKDFQSKIQFPPQMNDFSWGGPQQWGSL